MLFIIFCGFGSAGFSDTAIRWTTATMFDPVTITTPERLAQVDASGSPIYLQLAIPGASVVTPPKSKVTGKALEKSLPSDDHLKVKYFYYQWPTDQAESHASSSAIIVAAALEQNYASIKPYNFDALELQTLDCIFEQLKAENIGACASTLAPSERAKCLYNHNTTEFARRVPKKCGLLIGHLQPALEVANHDTFLKLDRGAQKRYWKDKKRDRKRRDDTPLMIHALVVNMPYYSALAVVMICTVPAWLCGLLIYRVSMYVYCRWGASKTKLFFNKIERRSIRRLRSYFPKGGADKMATASLPHLVAWLDNAAANDPSGLKTFGQPGKGEHATLTDSAFIATAGIEQVLVLYFGSGDRGQPFRVISVSSICFVDPYENCLVVKHVGGELTIKLPPTLSPDAVGDMLLLTESHNTCGSYASRRQPYLDRFVAEERVRTFTNDEKREREQIMDDFDDEQRQLPVRERLGIDSGGGNFRPQPASDAVRAMMRATSAKWPFPDCSEGTDHDCVICLCEIETGEEVAKWPACKHYFHLDCVLEHARRNHVCPLCRSEVEKAPDVQQGHSFEDMMFLRQYFNSFVQPAVVPR